MGSTIVKLLLCCPDGHYMKYTWADRVSLLFTLFFLANLHDKFHHWVRVLLLLIHCKQLCRRVQTVCVCVCTNNNKACWPHVLSATRKHLETQSNLIITAALLLKVLISRLMKNLVIRGQINFTSSSLYVMIAKNGKDALQLETDE